MMRLWTLLLLQLPFVVGGALPAPLNVSIESLDMEHMLRWLPGPGSPADTHFRVHTSHREFKEPLDQYWVRVQAFTQTQTSNWTLSGPFMPLTDTVLSPPEVSVTGCGNCLMLRVSPPATPRGTQQYMQLHDLYRGSVFVVRRTRDGSQFSLNFPYEKETVIDYLEPRVEYCVTVTVTTNFNPNSVPSKPHCAFTSPPATNTVQYTVLSLICVFCLLVIMLAGLAACGGQLFSNLSGRLSNSLSSMLLYGQSQQRTPRSDQFNQHISTLPLSDDTDSFLASP